VGRELFVCSEVKLTSFTVPKRLVFKGSFGDLKGKTGVELLQGIEDEFRNQYWLIRAARRTHWQAVNRTRVLAEFMYILGVPRWAVKEARYCLRVPVCERCYSKPLRCHSVSGRMQRGDFKT
jgi:hypothetical protein